MEYHVACGYLCKLHATRTDVNRSTSHSNGFAQPEMKTLDNDDVFAHVRADDVVTEKSAVNGCMPTSRSSYDVTLKSRSRPMTSLYKTLSRALRLRSTNDVSAKRSRSVTSIFRRSCDVSKSQSHNDFRWSQHAPVVCDVIGSLESLEEVSHTTKAQLFQEKMSNSITSFVIFVIFFRHFIIFVVVVCIFHSVVIFSWILIARVPSSPWDLRFHERPKQIKNDRLKNHHQMTDSAVLSFLRVSTVIESLYNVLRSIRNKWHHCSSE